MCFDDIVDFRRIRGIIVLVFNQSGVTQAEIVITGKLMY